MLSLLYLLPSFCSHVSSYHCCFFTLSLHPPPPPPSLSVSDKAINSTLYAFFSTPTILQTPPLFALSPSTPSVAASCLPQHLCPEEMAKDALHQLINLSLSCPFIYSISCSMCTNTHAFLKSYIFTNTCAFEWWQTLEWSLCLFDIAFTAFSHVSRMDLIDEEFPAATIMQLFKA